MEDTTHDIRERVHHIVAGKTPGERLMMCAEMHEEAKEFARIGMPNGLSPKDQELFIFQRIHGKSPLEMINS